MSNTVRVPALIKQKATHPLEADLPESVDFTDLTPRQKRFLKAFLVYGVITHAARAAGITRQTYWLWLQPASGEEVSRFSQAFRLAEEMLTERAEAALQQRAILGWDKPIVYRGKIVGYERVYSDELLKLYLKARRPNVYRETMKLEAPHRVLEDVPDDHLLELVTRALTHDSPTDTSLPDFLRNGDRD